MEPDTKTVPVLGYKTSSLGGGCTNQTMIATEKSIAWWDITAMRFSLFFLKRPNKLSSIEGRSSTRQCPELPKELQTETYMVWKSLNHWLQVRKPSLLSESSKRVLDGKSFRCRLHVRRSDAALDTVVRNQRSHWLPRQLRRRSSGRVLASPEWAHRFGSLRCWRFRILWLILVEDL